MARERRPASETISYEELKEFGKTHLKEPVTQQYLNEDVVVVVRSHVSFLEAVAPFTRRLNPSSVGLMVKEQFRMSSREADLFGQAMHKALGHCQVAGRKATTGKTQPVMWLPRPAFCIKPAGGETQSPRVRHTSDIPPTYPGPHCRLKARFTQRPHSRLKAPFSAQGPELR